MTNWAISVSRAIVVGLFVLSMFGPWDWGPNGKVGLFEGGFVSFWGFVAALILFPILPLAALAAARKTTSRPAVACYRALLLLAGGFVAYGAASAEGDLLPDVVEFWGAGIHMLAVALGVGIEMLAWVGRASPTRDYAEVFR